MTTRVPGSNSTSPTVIGIAMAALFGSSDFARRRIALILAVSSLGLNGLGR
jgi:hypothetical protein